MRHSDERPPTQRHTLAGSLKIDGNACSHRAAVEEAVARNYGVESMIVIALVIVGYCALLFALLKAASDADDHRGLP